MKSSTSKAFEYCKNLAKSHYENFPVASRFIAPEKRNYVWAIYAFARTADDFADERSNKDESLKLLKEWDQKLDYALDSEPEEPIFMAIKKTIEDCDIPPALLHDLVTAFRRDVLKNRHDRFEDLLDYCRYSANPIGRLVLLVHGYQQEPLFELSDSICTGLQLINFWQDVSVDLKKDRIYIPQDFFRQYNYSEPELFKHTYNENFKNMIKALCDKTEQIFKNGFPLVEYLNKDLKSEIQATLLGGEIILNKIRKHKYNVLKKRPTLNAFDKLKLAGKLLAKKGPNEKVSDYATA